LPEFATNEGGLHALAPIFSCNSKAIDLLGQNRLDNAFFPIRKTINRLEIERIRKCYDPSLCAQKKEAPKNTFSKILLAVAKI
jgi:hypothetical protein